jgi:ATP-dependent HslUV protease ATP-binding subunit HslU
MGPEFQNLFEKILPTRSRTRRLTVAAARRVLLAQETDRLVDQEKIVAEALARAQDRGIIFLDELDKIVGGEGESAGPDVSRFGVQRDLLPIVEGSTVTTRHGMVKTDHILFIAAGAFTSSSPAELIPELQGRFPIRVQLEDLGREEFIRILTEPQNALIKQQVALLATEGVALTFTEEAIEEIALLSERANDLLQNIGARRLYTILEKVLEDIQFNASDAANKEVAIDADYVRIHVADILLNEEESRTVL